MVIFKLTKIGISSQFVLWVENLLSNRKQIVSVDGQESCDCHVISGVLQGAVLGLLLFLIFINNLPSIVCR